MPAPLMVELFAGLHGWGAGALAEGWRVVGFDIVDMCKEIGEPKPDGDVQLVLQDVRTLHGSQFKDADLIVGSSPCQKYSYMAMPWTRAKAQAAEIRADATGAKFRALNELFDAQFRIQREACEAAGRYIPMVVENVKGAQPWVGKARWNFGSYYLWGDVPAIMPIASAVKVGGLNWSSDDPEKRKAFNTTAERRMREGVKNESGGSWFGIGSNNKVTGNNPRDRRIREPVPAHLQTLGGDWFSYPDSTCRRHSSKSKARKAASAQIAKIPEALSLHIARVFKPR